MFCFADRKIATNYNFKIEASGFETYGLVWDIFKKMPKGKLLNLPEYV